MDKNIIPCECATWARDDSSNLLFLDHHPNCKQYKPEQQIRDLLLRLIDGIEDWANDEDYVHRDCWEAYCDACAVVGQWNRPQIDREDK